MKLTGWWLGRKDRETESIAAVPMILGGKALGMLSVQSYQAGCVH
jgi:hypothetical protein